MLRWPRQARDLFEKLVASEELGGLLLLIAAIVALAWANSPWSESYRVLWETPLSVSYGEWALSKSLRHWVNDGLMAVFFFVVGLEIKRELLVGELSSRKKAMLPVAAALGGMLVPALIYLALNRGTAGVRGWGVPIATDIAFAVGILAVLGPRVPRSATLFVTGLAVADDIGAVLVIAIFYTHDISWVWLGLSGLAMAALLALNLLGVKRPFLYVLGSVALWVAVMESGVHATLAGVLAAFVVPARTALEAPGIVEESARALEDFERIAHKKPGSMLTDAQADTLMRIRTMIDEARSPLRRLEETTGSFVYYVVLPLFALANAGTAVTGHVSEIVTTRVGLGIVLGLVVGKQLGVLGFARLAAALGLARLPGDMSWRHVYGCACLAGVGFTMALFVQGLAFAGGDTAEVAKLAVLAASVMAGLWGYAVLRAGRGAGR